MTVAVRSPAGGTINWKFGPNSTGQFGLGSNLLQRLVVRVPAEDVTPEASELAVEVSMPKDAPQPHI